MAIDIRHQFSSSFSDFVTRYTAVSSTNKKTETAEYYAKDPDDGLTMNLGVNPLLQFGLEETRKSTIKTTSPPVMTGPLQGSTLTKVSPAPRLIKGQCSCD